MDTVINTQANQIVVDSSLQPRVRGLDADHVRVLQEAPEGWPPLLVVQRGDLYLLIDGFHRLAAAQNLALDTVRVKVSRPPKTGICTRWLSPPTLLTVDHCRSRIEGRLRRGSYAASLSSQTGRSDAAAGYPPTPSGSFDSVWRPLLKLSKPPSGLAVMVMCTKSARTKRDASPESFPRPVSRKRSVTW